MKILSCRNDKGGVGKTTATGSIAHGLASKGHKVLMIDADPQGTLTSWFNPEFHHSFKDLAVSFKSKNPMKLADVIVSVRENLFLLATDDGEQLRELETLKLNGDPAYISRYLKPQLEELQFDYVVIDYAPAWGVLEKSLSFLVDEFYLIITPDSFSMFGMQQQYMHLAEAREITGKNILCDCILINNVDERKTRVETPIRDAIKKDAEKKNQQAIEIRTDSELKEIQSLRQTPFDSAYKKTKIKKDYESIINTIERGNNG